MATSNTMYGVYISGPDDLQAVKDYEAGLELAKFINNGVPPETAIEATVIEWPHDDRSYIESLRHPIYTSNPDC